MINHHSKILSLDPSSTIVGYAVMTADRVIVQAGTIEPNKKSAPSFERIVSLADDVWSILEQHDPATILIEWTIGKVGQRRHSGRGAGLAVYGCGLGWIACTCQVWIDSKLKAGGMRPRRELIPILENEWTRGVPKKDRQIAVASLYPAYKIETDPGGDIADAIGLAEWWLRQQLLA